MTSVEREGTDLPLQRLVVAPAMAADAATTVVPDSECC